MICFNKVELIGHVGRDPRVRTFDDGSKAADFSLATTYCRKTSNGGGEDETTWHNIVTYGAQAVFIEQYIRKGRLLLVEGRLRNRKYTNAAGTEVNVTEVVANSVQILDPASHNDPEIAVEQARRDAEKKSKNDDGDLPF